MKRLNPVKLKFMNIGGGEYKRDDGVWYEVISPLLTWVMCTHDKSRFLSWVAANES
jgi:hypothetical protein